MQKRIVYLAGFISTEATESLAWRERVKPLLAEAGFEVRNPLSSKQNLAANTPDGGVTNKLASKTSIVLRDRRDVRQSDVILVHLETFGNPRPLVGTIAELAWAWDESKPVVAIAQDKNYLMRNHPFIAEFVSEYFTTEEEAVDFIIKYYGS